MTGYFSQFREMFLAGLSELLFTCIDEDFGKELVLGKKFYYFYQSWILSKKCSDLLPKVSQRCSKLQFTSTDDHSKQEQIFRIKQNLIYFFGNSSIKFTEFCENFMHDCQNCILHKQRNNSRKFDFGEKTYRFYHFWILNKTCSDFLRKKFRHGGQNCI